MQLGNIQLVELSLRLNAPIMFSKERIQAHQTLSSLDQELHGKRPLNEGRNK